MHDGEQPREIRSRARNGKFWQRVGVGILGLTAASGVVGVNKALEDTNKNEAHEIAGHVLELNNAVSNDDHGIDSQEELDNLKAKLGDKVDLRVVPKAEHSSVIAVDDSFKADETSPMTEIKWGHLKKPKFVLLGTVHYEGPMSAARLIAVGPDGREFFTDTDASPAVDMFNPILEPTSEGLVFYGATDSAVTRITISYDGILRTVTHEGYEADQAQANRYSFTVNGQSLDESRTQVDPSKKGEIVIAELQAKADEYIMAITATNDTLGLGTDPMKPAIGEVDKLTRAQEVKIGELPSGESVGLNGPRSIIFVDN